MMKNLSFVMLLALAISCGSRNKSNNTQPEPEGATEVAIVRAPIGADGQPDLSKAELRTGIAKSDISNDDAVLAKSFDTMGTVTNSKVAANEEELDLDSSTQSWYLLPWRAAVANGYPVRSGPYLLPWRAAIANGYPVRSGGYLLPWRAAVANSQYYWMYGGGGCGNYVSPYGTYPNNGCGGCYTTCY